MNSTTTTIPHPPAQISAAMIAAALGKPARVIRRALEGTRADGKAIVRGNLTQLWQLESLPAGLKEDLESARVQRGLKCVEHLFNRPAHVPADWQWCEPWQPEFPWNEVSAEQQAEALRLQRSQLPALARRNEAGLSATELDALGVAAYQREFPGRTITPDRWRYLLNRTIERDRGAEQFHRPELFLPGNLKRAAKASELRQKPALSDSDFKPLLMLITKGFGDPLNPTSDEKAKLWTEAVKLFDQLAETAKPKKVKRRLLSFLWERASFLAKSPNALRVNFDRRLQGGDDANAQADGRCDRRGHPVLPAYDPEQIKLAKLSAADCTGGQVVTALRELNAAGQITDPRIKHALDTAGSKSYLPASLRAEFKDVEAWRIIAKGERYTRKLRPRRKLTYDGIFSMTALVGDDKTPDLYIAVPDGNGWWTPMRPQMILISDYRSDFIIGHGITPTPQYKVMDFYGPFKRIFKKYGLPQFIVREGGLWRNSHLANSLADIGKGTKERNLHRFSPAEIEYGLERRGVGFVGDVSAMEAKLGSVAIQFRESYCPNSKPVEGVIRLLTQTMERLPCYSGRREMDDCPQKTREAVAAVKSRKASPHEVGMLVWDQWCETVHALIAKHNSTKQEGRKLRDPLTGAPLSPEEAFDVFQNRDDLPAAFDAGCEVLLSHVQQEVTVHAPDLRRKQFPCGFVELRGHTYCDEQTGARIGQKLLAHWDPEFPETCTFTDMKLRHPFTVARLNPNNALFEDPQTAITTAQAQRTINVPRAEYHATKAKFAPVLRQTFVAPLVKELNAHTKEQTAAIQERKENDTRRRSKVASRLRQLNPDVAAVARNAMLDGVSETSDGSLMILRADETEARAEEGKRPSPSGPKDYFLQPSNPGGQNK